MWQSSSVYVSTAWAFLSFVDIWFYGFHQIWLLKVVPQLTEDLFIFNYFLCV